MNRKTSIIVLFILLLLVVGYINSLSRLEVTEVESESRPEVTEVESDLYLYAKKLNDVEVNSEIIVKAQLKEVLENHVEYDDLKIPHYGYTLFLIDIKKVYKGEDKVQNDTLQIREPFYYYYGSGRKIIITFKGYRPIQKNVTYILFLSKSYMENTWYCTGIYQGKYILKDNEKLEGKSSKATAENLDVGESVLDAVYINLYQEVMQKYGMELSPTS